MKIAFRIECPYCRWGSPWKDEYVNQGWIKVRCNHCPRNFYTKISIPTIDIKVVEELTDGLNLDRN